MKRVYDETSPDDGERILVDRLWPRGISREGGRIDLWMKEIAPSTELRKWFSHDPSRWQAFRQKYLRELEEKKVLLTDLRQRASAHGITLLFASRETRINHAAVLKEVIEKE